MTKLCRYRLNGHEKPGLVDSSGTLRDLSSLWNDLTPGLSSSTLPEQARRY